MGELPELIEVLHALQGFRDQVRHRLHNFCDIVTESAALSSNVTVEGLNLLERATDKLADSLDVGAEKAAKQITEAFKRANEEAEPDPHEADMDLFGAASWLINSLDSECDQMTNEAIKAVKSSLRRERAGRL